MNANEQNQETDIFDLWGMIGEDEGAAAPQVITLPTPTDPWDTYPMDPANRAAAEAFMLNDIMKPGRAFEASPAAPAPKVNINKERPDILSSCVVLSLTLKKQGNGRKVPTSMIEVEADKDWIGVSKQLLDSPELKVIQQIDAETRQRVYASGLTVTWLKDGTYLIPLVSVDKIDQFLQDQQAKRANAVRDFIEAYDAHVAQAKIRLDKVFNANDYPPKEELSKAFKMDWGYLQIGTPGEGTLSKALYQRERAKMESNWKAAADEITATLRAAMRDLVAHMVTRLQPDAEGKKKRFSESAITNLQEFLSEIQARNVTNDTELTALADKAKEVMKGIDAKAIRTNEAVRSNLAASFATLKTSLDALVEDAPVREFGDWD